MVRAYDNTNPAALGRGRIVCDSKWPLGHLPPLLGALDLLRSCNTRGIGGPRPRLKLYITKLSEVKGLHRSTESGWSACETVGA